MSQELLSLYKYINNSAGPIHPPFRRIHSQLRTAQVMSTRNLPTKFLTDFYHYWLFLFWPAPLAKCRRSWHRPPCLDLTCWSAAQPRSDLLPSPAVAGRKSVNGRQQH
ncbi:hypothetical protein ElyMa_004208200 [Elysia marginata]|uniref:Uncharacterized protein n=1 Tax=Elysia marginata TaxID=1093978 RepID=A0AAV4GM85_9GAST|nr:hypothetical protein ElyMa_004208200 [Elysia marginata]